MVGVWRKRCALRILDTESRLEDGSVEFWFKINLLKNRLGSLRVYVREIVHVETTGSTNIHKYVDLVWGVW